MSYVPTEQNVKYQTVLFLIPRQYNALKDGERISHKGHLECALALICIVGVGRAAYKCSHGSPP